jgi:DNA-binding transcriptional MocR family regulator
MAITDALARDIASGHLPAETRLPTHRELADEMKVAVGTVTRAYAEAEKRGLIYSLGRAGTFVGSARSGGLRLVNAYEQPSDLIDLTRYRLAVSEDPDLLTTFRKLSRRSANQSLLQYTPPGGLRHHRKAGAAWIARLGREVAPHSVVLTAGAQNALNIVLSMIARRGDWVVAESHTYPSLPALAELHGLNLIAVDCDDEGPLPDAFEAICRQKKPRSLFTNPTLNNPTSITVSEARRRQIASIAVRHEVLIIEDAVNHALSSDPPPLFCSIAPEITFLIASLSKVLAAGLRVCYMVGPSHTTARLQELVHTSVHIVSPICLEIAAMWISDGTAERTLALRRNECRTRYEIAMEVLGERKLITSCEAYSGWLELPPPWTAKEFVLEAFARGVKLSPAESFAVEKEKAGNAVRICLGGNTSRESLRRGLLIIRDMLDKPSQLESPRV